MLASSSHEFSHRHSAKKRPDFRSMSSLTIWTVTMPSTVCSFGPSMKASSVEPPAPRCRAASSPSCWPDANPMRSSSPRARSTPSELNSSLRSAASARACNSSMRCSPSQMWPVPALKRNSESGLSKGTSGYPRIVRREQHDVKRLAVCPGSLVGTMRTRVNFLGRPCTWNQKMLDLKDVFYFVQVVDRGGFTSAGHSLRLPKSTLSHRVQELEASLGVRLINRTSRQFGMTDV